MSFVAVILHGLCGAFVIAYVLGLTLTPSTEETYFLCLLMALLAAIQALIYIIEFILVLLIKERLQPIQLERIEQATT